MNTKEKKPTKKEKESGKDTAGDGVEDQSEEMTLGDELLIREFERSERIRKLFAKNKSEEKD